MPVQLLCANCQSPAIAGCANYHMIVYCNATCQKQHWASHKAYCKSPILQKSWQTDWAKTGRKPDFGTADGPSHTSFGGNKDLWGNLPAFDVLKLANNEGAAYAKDLNLLFAASRDPRNIIKTIADLPLTCKSKISVVVNDREIGVVARNVILLLIALNCPDEKKAVECMIHMWYSASIRKVDEDIISIYVRPLILDVVNKLTSESDDGVWTVAWKFDTRSLRVELTKADWNLLLAYLKVPEGLTSTEANRIRQAIVLAPTRKDYQERFMAAQFPEHRLCMYRFRNDSVLLPFGHSRDEFTLVNP